MKTRTIKVATDFSKYPGGRSEDQGPYSGEEFREKHLIPAIHENDKVVVDLNGLIGLPSSFIDEAFGILVEKLGIEMVRGRLEIVLDDDPVSKREITVCMEQHSRTK